ncbi:MAG TPA: DnaJ domain-containing protein [Polyangiaceae bacterium]|jgi:tetratricopeptide (TPR) repeat protein|nr:DnaJ domain-containing protein [Polyangiaceae bacterium]
MGDPPQHRPAPAASGTLAKTPFVHLLIYAADKKLGGTIEVIGADKRAAEVLFVGGQPAKVRTSEAVSLLGEVLVDLGHLSPSALELSLDELADMRSSSQVLHGQMLVQKGIVEAEELDAALHEQLSRRLQYIAAMPGEASYAYYDRFDALDGWGGTSAHGVDPMPMLWTILRQSAIGTHLDTALQRVAASSLRIAKTANLSRLALAKELEQAVDLLRVRPLTVAEFPRVTGLPERDARLLAYLLLVTKQVEVMSASPSMRPITTPGQSMPAVTGRLTPPPTVSPSGLPGTPVPPSPRGAVSKSLFPPGASRSKPPPGLPIELADRWKAIVDRARTIDRADYFNMLELARDSTPEEAEEAFYAMAKKWHPDRLPLELGPVREACSRVFSRMSEAHATLTDPDKRARYMRLLDDGSGSPEMQETVAKVVEAATDFQKAEVCFKRNDLEQAEALCRKAAKLDSSQPDYQALLAWLISLKRESQAPEKLVECIQMLDRAIQLSDRCERAYLYRGMLYKRVNRNESAMRDFRRVVELNPQNIDAAREVRLHNMRGGTARRSTPPGAQRSTQAPGPTKPEDKGILGRFFKK